MREETERTPGGRLADMPGTVVRVWQLTEVHVYDAEQTLQAASEAGNNPFDDLDPPTELAVAVSGLLGQTAQLPGADEIHYQAISQALDPHDDELADYRTVFAPEFETGNAS